MCVCWLLGVSSCLRINQCCSADSICMFRLCLGGYIVVECVVLLPHWVQIPVRLKVFLSSTCLFELSLVSSHSPKHGCVVCLKTLNCLSVNMRVTGVCISSDGLVLFPAFTLQYMCWRWIPATLFGYQAGEIMDEVCSRGRISIFSDLIASAAKHSGQAKCMLGCEIISDGRTDTSTANVQIPAPTVFPTCGWEAEPRDTAPDLPPSSV